MTLNGSYLNQKIEEHGYDDLYGFLEPQSIQKSGNKKEEAINYINDRIKNSQKQIYLAPYIDQNHWQLLVLCPMSNVVVWFCSLHHKPTIHVKHLVKSYKQQGHYECGYYVMNWMSEIIEGGVTNGWSEVHLKILLISFNAFYDVTNI
uniref:Ubiquitin-like protease family profile domain-containing protein n=1 Tax=Cajanus cajan TaxID=3821 RepID=A0A151QQ35_CAJCA|nr:hypothetical protein KK1_046978 [Cajanus cajan]